MQSEVVRAEMESRVSEILFYVWDPIGVNGMPSCRDEYQSYVSIVSAYLLHNFAEAGLDALLMFIMEEYIGVNLVKTPRRKHQHLETLRMLMEWRQDSFQKYPDAKSFAPKFPKDASFLDQIAWSQHCCQLAKERQSNTVSVGDATKG